MSRTRRGGLRRRPITGWPLDRLLVGPATLGTLRELYRQDGPARAWDVALETGISVQGAADALERIAAIGLVTMTPATRYRARTYRLDPDSPLYSPLSKLFKAERQLVRAAGTPPTSLASTWL